MLGFGNSGGDTAMHVYTKTNNPCPAEAFMLVADEVRDYGVPEKAAKLAADWQEKRLPSRFDEERIQDDLLPGSSPHLPHEIESERHLKRDQSHFTQCVIHFSYFFG